MTRRLLALVAWAGALVAVFGAALVEPNVMGIAGIVGAVAAIAWGLLGAIEKCRVPNLADVWARRDQEAAEDELPYMPVDEGVLMYEHEADEWRRGVADMSEADREVTYEKSRRAAVGAVGDREDERYG